MKIADQITAWLVLILGAVHCVVTPRVYPAFNLAAMWFLGTGLLMMLVGAVNLLRVRYPGASGVLGVSLAANVITLAFAGEIAARLPLKQNPQAVVIVVLLLLEMIFSIVQSVRRSQTVTAAVR